MIAPSLRESRTIRFPVAVLATALAAGVFALEVHGQDFWRQRPATDWTSKEAKIMLMWSPWARPARLQMFNPSTLSPGNTSSTSKPDVGTGGMRQHERDKVLGDTATPVQDRFFLASSGPKLVPLAGLGTCAGPACADGRFGTGGQPIPKVSREPVTDGTPPIEGISLPDDVVIVLWDSAAPVQDAKRGLGIADGIKDRFADYFVISVIGYPVRFDFSRISPGIRANILDSATLLLRDKKQIKPADMSATNSGNTVVLRFFFPRRKAIEEKEKEVIFRFLFGPNLVESKFVLKEMHYNGKLTL